MTALALKLNDLRLPEACRQHWRAWAVLGAMAALWLVAAISVGVQSVTPRPELDRVEATSPELARIRAAATATSATALAAGQPADRDGAQRGDPDRPAGQSGGDARSICAAAPPIRRARSIA